MHYNRQITVLDACTSAALHLAALPTLLQMIGPRRLWGVAVDVWVWGGGVIGNTPTAAAANLDSLLLHLH